MAEILAGSNFPLAPLADVEVQGGARARANVATALAGRQRALDEFINGVVKDGSSPCAPLSGARGRPGHAHNGGVGARPIQHSPCILVFGYGPDAITPTNGDAIQNSVAAGTPGASNLGTPRDIFDDVVYVPLPPSSTSPTPDRDGQASAYDNMAMSVLVRSSSASLATATIEVRATCAGVNVLFDGTCAVNTTTHVVSTGDNVRLRMRPGKMNAVRVRVTLVRGTDDATVAVLAMGWHQVQDVAVIL